MVEVVHVLTVDVPIRVVCIVGLTMLAYVIELLLLLLCLMAMLLL